MDPLPAFLTRPPVLLADAAPAPVADADPAESTLRQALDGGIPAHLPLAGQRSLVLGVGLGKARELLAADPAAVLIDAGTDPHDSDADPDRPIARLTLIDGSVIGETVPVVTGVRAALVVSGRVAVEVVVDALTVTAGSLRSPGKYGSSITLRWRPVGPAPDLGPPPPAGDPSLPRFRVWRESLAARLPVELKSGRPR